MSVLIILIVFGLGMAYFATQNTGLIHLSVANFNSSGIPLYVVVIGSMLLGIFISWLISIVNSLTASLRMRKINSQIKDANLAMDALKKQNAELLKENATLKGEKEEVVTEVSKEEQIKEEKIPRPSIFHRVKQSLA